MKADNFYLAGRMAALDAEDLARVLDVVLTISKRSEGERGLQPALQEAVALLAAAILAESQSDPRATLPSTQETD